MYSTGISQQLTVTNISSICQLQSRANSNNNKRKSPGKQAVTNVRFFSLGDHHWVVKIYV